MMFTMEIVWNLFYWITFFMCWAVLPFLSEYVAAGEFTTKGKVYRSIINNLIFYAIAAVFFLIFLIYLYLKGTFKDLALKGFIIALSNAWGLLLIIVFLSHGLVSVPKHFFARTNLDKMANIAFFKVAQTEDALQNAKLHLEDLIQNVLTMSNRVTDPELRTAVD